MNKLFFIRTPDIAKNSEINADRIINPKMPIKRFILPYSIITFGIQYKIMIFEKNEKKKKILKAEISGFFSNKYKIGARKINPKKKISNLGNEKEYNRDERIIIRRFFGLSLILQR